MKCSVFVGVSLDGFMARRDGRFDFLPADGGEEHGYTAFIASVDAIVMGRGTFDVVRRFAQWPFRQPVIVLTRSACDGGLPADADIELMAGRPGEIVERLEARGMQHLYVDGGITIQRFLDAGLIDHATITRVPVLIGDGIPLFGPTRRDIKLRHVETQSYASGLVTTRYDVVRERPTGR